MATNFNQEFRARLLQKNESVHRKKAGDTAEAKVTPKYQVQNKPVKPTKIIKAVATTVEAIKPAKYTILNKDELPSSTYEPLRWKEEHDVIDLLEVGQGFFYPSDDLKHLDNFRGAMRAYGIKIKITIATSIKKDDKGKYSGCYIWRVK